MRAAPRGRQESGGTGSCNAGEGSTEGCRRKKTRVVADVWAAIAERKRKREQDSAQRHEAAPHAKQRREDEDDGTEITTHRHAEMSCRQQTDASATEKVTLPKGSKSSEERQEFPICWSRLPKVCEEQYTHGPGKSPTRMR